MTFDASHRLRPWPCTFGELTDRKQREEELRGPRIDLEEQLQQMDQLYRTAPVDLELVDHDLRILPLNERLATANGGDDHYT